MTVVEEEQRLTGREDENQEHIPSARLDDALD